MAPFLIMKQTLLIRDEQLGLAGQGAIIDAGLYKNMVFKHDKQRHILFGVGGIHSEKLITGEVIRKPEAQPKRHMLTFSQPTTSSGIKLQKYELQDDTGRILFSRELQSNGKYSLPSFVDEFKQDYSGISAHPLLSTVYDDQPWHFFFTGSARELIDMMKEVRTHLVHPSKEAQLESAEAQAIRLVLTYAEWAAYGLNLGHLLRTMSYVGPLRARPERLYEYVERKPLDVGPKGNFAPQIVNDWLETGQKDLIEELNFWLRKFEFGEKIERQTLFERGFSLEVRGKRARESISIADTGFGLSQVLPLIVQCLYSQENELIIAEQPEIHLNPKLQNILADLFCRFATAGRTIVIETHSEHLLLRLRTLVARQEIRAEDVALYYVEKIGQECKIREVKIEEDGHIPDEEWPRGFMEEYLREPLALALAQARRSSDAQ